MALRAAETQVAQKPDNRATILVIHERTAEGECLASALERACPDFRVVAQSRPPFEGSRESPDLVLSVLDEIVHDAASLSRSIEALKTAFDGVPFVIVTEEEATVPVSASLFAHGASGCLSHSAGLEGLTKMLWLVLHGGICFPRKGLVATAAEAEGAATQEAEASVRDALEPPDPEEPQGVPDTGLTCRETEVVEKLRMGKPNKIIAYELGISISTVKVHLRNIMRKTGATNRVEAVLLTSVASGTTWPVPSHR
ncbi:helix-turn-helix transcriptional regulator [Roseicyclus sp.]|uniref:helix-turn-helix transcriptional regulator n=1 Tax=Roseicyclus sp. TaxID=1914329 RepID=UPI003FA0C1C1